MNDLRKKDSVADSIQSILEKELSTKQKKIAKMSPPEDKIDAGDLAKLRAGHKPTSEEIDPNNTTTDTLKGREKKSDNRFLSKKVLMDVPGNVKEESEQLDELKKSTVKSYIGKKMDSLPGKDPKKDQESLMRAHHRVTGVKPTSESVKTLKSFREEIEEPILDELINEVLGKDASAGDWIHDFVHSDNPKFKGKSKAKRKEMALAAYYAKQRNEEVEQIDEGKMKELAMDLKDMSHDEFQKQYGKPKSHFTSNPKETGATVSSIRAKLADKKMAKEEIEVEESANPFSPDYKSQMKTKPGEKAGFDSKKISTGTVYSKKHKAEPEDDKKKVNEMKRPESDTVPFVSDVPFEGPYKKSSSASVVDKSGAKHTPMSRVKHLAKQSMKNVKAEMMGKTGTSE
jgi:hypothetical protein